jgi:hypothetical protein
MYFYAVIFIAILLPLLMRQKKIAFRISIILLFILFGFQYELVQDWEPNIGRWMYVNGNGTFTGLGQREIEPLFAWILRVCKPLSFFGFLMVLISLFLLIFYQFVVKFVPPKYYWLSLFVFLMRTDNALLYINSNRQTVALMFSFLAVFILWKIIPLPKFIDNLAIRLFLSLVLVYAGAHCHASGYGALLIYPVYFVAQYYKGERWIVTGVAASVIYLARLVVDISFLQGFSIAVQNAVGVEGWDEYFDLLGSEINDRSIFETISFLIIIWIIAYSYRYVDTKVRFFMLYWFAGFLINNYFLGSAGRLGEYGYYFLPIAFPIAFDIVRREKNDTVARYLSFGIVFVIAYFIFSFFKETITGDYYYRWLNYKSIFGAPTWI